MKYVCGRTLLCGGNRCSQDVVSPLPPLRPPLPLLPSDLHNLPLTFSHVNDVINPSDINRNQ